MRDTSIEYQSGVLTIREAALGASSDDYEYLRAAYKRNFNLVVLAGEISRRMLADRMFIVIYGVDRVGMLRATEVHHANGSVGIIISDFCIDEPYRKRGIGSEALGFVSKYLHGREGIDYVELLTGPENESFYSGLSFKINRVGAWMRLEPEDGEA